MELTDDLSPDPAGSGTSGLSVGSLLFAVVIVALVTIVALLDVRSVRAVTLANDGSTVPADGSISVSMLQAHGRVVTYLGRRVSPSDVGDVLALLPGLSELLLRPRLTTVPTAIDIPSVTLWSPP